MGDLRTDIVKRVNDEEAIFVGVRVMNRRGVWHGTSLSLTSLCCKMGTYVLEKLVRVVTEETPTVPFDELLSDRTSFRKLVLNY